MRACFSDNRVLGLLVAGFLVLCAGYAGAADRQVVRRAVPMAAVRAQRVGRVVAEQRFNFVLALPLRNAQALTNLLAAVYDPASPQYHHFLTPEQFTAQFGPARQDYQALVAYAQARGFRVVREHPNRTLVTVNAAVPEIERAFGVTMGTYQHPKEHRTFHAPDANLSLDLAVRVLAVCGLDDFAQPRPSSRMALAISQLQGAGALNGSGTYGTFLGKDFRAAYAPGVTLTGAGQTVGLLQFDGYNPAAITAYKNQAGLPNVPLTNVLLDGFNGAPGVNNAEVCLDIEMAISMAPGLDRVIIYEADPYFGIPNDILNRMASDNIARQLSSSWTWGSGADPVADQIYQQMALQGQSFFQASGDSDAYTGDIAMPADNPYITVVGGTRLTMSGNGVARASETTWNWNNGTGTGGGISTVYPIPAWQQGIDMTANHGSTTMRNIPDVALTADNILVRYNSGAEGYFGGTSCAAPLWAGFCALMNQQAAINSLPPLGFLNPMLYWIGRGSSSATAFHDITSGNNFSASSPSNFPAVAGYDLCTGWGAPNGSNTINLLVPFNALRIMPLQLPTFTGPAGGVFNPASMNLLMTNASASSLSWSAGATSSWFTVTPVSGTLAAGDVVSLAVSLTAAASNLAAQTYSGTIWFTNSLGGTSQSRSFSLQVGNALFITPSTGVVFAGTAGGPFALSSSGLLLSNASAASLAWSAGATSTWLRIEPASGTLAAGTTTNIAVRLTAEASNLVAQTYTGTAWFTNTLDGVDQSRTFTLQAGPPLRVAPLTGATFVGDVGGPFRANANTVLLTNAGLSSLNWSAGSTSAWLTVVPAGGTLPAGGATRVTLCLTAVASNLPAQIAVGTAWFADSLDSVAQNCNVTLLVGQPVVLNGDFETADLTYWDNTGYYQNNVVFNKNITYNNWLPPIPGALVVHSGTYGLMLGAYGALGYVSQTLQTVSRRHYLLSCWVRNPDGGTPSEFLVQWGTNTLCDLVNSAPFDWTNLQFVVQATAPTTRLTFGGRNDPNEFALDDISVQMLDGSWPLVDNRAPSDISATSAVLNGSLVDTGGTTTTIRIYWGLSDGGDTNWSNCVDIGPCDLGDFSASISGLAASTRYYYRCFASNASGVAWADAATNFTTRNQYAIAATAGAMGRIAPSGAVWVVEGGGTNLVITPDAHWHVADVVVDGVSVGPTNSYAFVNVTNGHTIHASFGIDQQILTVASPFGGALPGSLTAGWGTSLCQLITNSPLLNGTTQYLCTGGAVVGNAYTLIAPTNVVLTLTNNAALTWRWTTNYWLATGTNGPGAVSVGSGWRGAGSNVTVMAIPTTKSHFVQWSGSTSGCLAAFMTLTVPMTQPRVITAVFAAGATPVISGKVTRSGTTVGVPQVMITFSGVPGVAITDARGFYSMVVPYGWSGTVTASFCSGGFTVPSKTFRSVTTAKTDQNFAWTPPPVISGRVTQSISKSGKIVAGVTNVTVSASNNGGAATTGVGGSYSLTVPYGWTGVVTVISSSGGVFSPPNKLFPVRVTANQTLSFTWIAPVGAVTPQAASNCAFLARPNDFSQWAAWRGLVGSPTVLFDQVAGGDGITYGEQYAFGGNLAPGEPLMRLLMVDGAPAAEVPLQDPATLIDASVLVEYTPLAGSGFWFPATCLPLRPATPLAKQWYHAEDGDAVDFRVTVEFVK